MSKILNFNEYISEKKSNHPKIYGAPEGSKRDQLLDKAQKLYKEGKVEQAAKIRREMEEAKKKKGCNLSKETESKIRKVSNKKGYTFSSLKSEYCKGLGAYVSSGSRKGMTAHQWAMARVNAATPSKSWANVKRKKKK